MFLIKGRDFHVEFCSFLIIGGLDFEMRFFNRKGRKPEISGRKGCKEVFDTNRSRYYFNKKTNVLLFKITSGIAQARN